MKFEDLKLGMKESISKVITEKNVNIFAEISSDTNPIHLDEEYASKTIFKKRIAHGILTTGLISAVLGTKLPGEGAIYLSQEIKFLAPVYLDDMITATVEVTELNEVKRKVTVSTICTNQEGKEVITGQAILLQKF